MIRSSHPGDIEQVLGMLEGLRRSTAYRAIEPNWPIIVHAINALAAKPTGFVAVAEHNSRITGILIAIAQAYWWQDDKTGARVVSDLIFHSRHLGDGPKLLEKMVRWAFTVPRVVRVECGISSLLDPKRLTKTYERAGFHREGGMFVVNHPRYAEALLPARRIA